MVRGLPQALLVVVGAAVAGLAIAGLWSALGGGDFRPKAGSVLLALGTLFNISSGATFSRSAAFEAGRRPDRDDIGTGGLTGLGVFLFVGLPLFLAGGALFGSG